MTVPRITLAIGGEAVLIDRAVASVATAVRKAEPTAQRTTIGAGDEGAAGDLREAAAPNLFGDAGVVVITGIDAADDDLVKALREVLTDLPESTHLVLTHPGGTKGKALLDELRKAGAEEVDCRGPKKGKETREFLTREFARRKRKVTPDAIVILYDAIGHDIGLLSSAVSQLCADIEAEVIDAAAVGDFFGGVAEVSGFTVADAVWDRRQADALETLRQAMLAGDPSRIGVLMVSSLASGLRTLVRVGGMPPGASDADVAREAGVPPWKVKDLRRQWTRWASDQRRLAQAVVALAEADGAVKGGVSAGTALDPEQKLLALELLVAGTQGSRTAIP